MWKQKEKFLSSFEENETFLFKDNNRKSTEYKVKGMEDGVLLLYSHKCDPIRIVGDYDVDGITSTTGLTILLSALEFKDVKKWIPRRFSNGYGLSEKIIDSKLEDGSEFMPKVERGLLITVDNGIAATDAILKAKEKGYDVLVLDHHMSDVIPPADVVIDPEAIEDSADFNMYCGAGLVYKLAQEIGVVPDFVMDKITVLAMIGTICDSVDLITCYNNKFQYDNYLIVKQGLELILQNSGRTSAMYDLLRKINKIEQINEKDIGFALGPIINAPGRLKDTGGEEMVNYLTLDNNEFSVIRPLTEHIVEFNDTRKDLTEKIKKALIQMIETEHMENDSPLIVKYVPKEGDANIYEGLSGIIAGQLSEMYKTDCFVFTPAIQTDENNNILVDDNNVPVYGELLKGSGRGYGNSNLKDALDKNVKLIEKYGGHALAAGVSILDKNFDEFKKGMSSVIEDVPDKDLDKEYDYEISINDVADTYESVKEFAPYGQGHSEPIFKITGFEAESKFKGLHYLIMGQNKNMVKMISNDIEAVDFKGKVFEKFKALKAPKKFTIYGTLSENSFNGKTTTQIRMLDIEV